MSDDNPGTDTTETDTDDDAINRPWQEALDLLSGEIDMKAECLTDDGFSLAAELFLQIMRHVGEPPVDISIAKLAIAQHQATLGVANDLMRAFNAVDICVVGGAMWPEDTLRDLFGDRYEPERYEPEHQDGSDVPL